jgi:hypothetical protein
MYIVSKLLLMVYSIDQTLHINMADVRTRPEPFLGRSILTPQPSRQRPTAKRTGNLFPVGHAAIGAGSTPSNPQDRPRYVAPTANMAPNPAHEDDGATPAYSGKGKGRATSPKSAQPPTTLPTSSLEEGEILSQDAKPILTSDVHPDSQQLAQEAARRIQEEVDRIESQRDREDGTFSPTAPEGDSQTQEYLEFNEIPRRRSRRRADDDDDDDAKMPPARQALGSEPLASRPKPAQQVPVQQRQQDPPMPRRKPLGPQSMPGAQQQQPTVDQLRARVRALETSARAPLDPQIKVPHTQAQQQERVRQLLQQRSVPQKRKATSESPSEPPQKSPKATNKTPLNRPPVTASGPEQPFNLPSPTDYRTTSERIVADARWNAYLARAVPGVHNKYGHSAPTRAQEIQQAEDQPAVPEDVHEDQDPAPLAQFQETQQAKNRRTHERHNNKRFELLKPHSQVQRRDALKTILETWSITEEQLKTLPYAPRQWQQDHLVMNPLDWNGKLLDAVAVLASNTKTMFARGCEIARLTFENCGPATGAKQLNAEIVSKAVSALCIARDDRSRKISKARSGQHASGNRQTATGEPSTNDASATLQSESDTAQSTYGNTSSGTTSDRPSTNTNTSPEGLPSKPSLIVKLKLPMAQKAPPGSQPSPPAAAAYSSPAATPIKTEQVVPIMVRDVPAHDDSQSSSSDERLNLESTRNILMHQLAIVQEQIALDERKKKEKERKAKKARQLGRSIDEPMVL